MLLSPEVVNIHAITYLLYSALYLVLWLSEGRTRTCIGKRNKNIERLLLSRAAKRHIDTLPARSSEDAGETLMRECGAERRVVRLLRRRCVNSLKNSWRSALVGRGREWIAGCILGYSKVLGVQYVWFTRYLRFGAGFLANCYLYIYYSLGLNGSCSSTDQHSKTYKKAANLPHYPSDSHTL